MVSLIDSIVNFSDAFTNNAVLIELVTALLILLFGLFIGRLVGRLILKLFKEVEIDKNLKKTTGFDVSFANSASKLISYLIYFLAVLMALDSLGLTPFVLNALSVIILVVIGVSVLLAIKDFVPNFFAGYTLRRKNVFRLGDRIRVGKIEGKVKANAARERELV